MGAIGMRRMKEKLEWRYQIPILLKAYGVKDCSKTIIKNTSTKLNVITKKL